MARPSDIDIRMRLRDARKFRTDAAKNKQALEGFRGTAKNVGKSFDDAGKKMTSFGSTMTKAVTLPVVGVGVASLKMATDWESAFAGVRKTVDATEPQFQDLERGIRDMSREIPTSAVELAGIAEAAGQLGVKRSAILGFTRTIADLGQATNLTGEEGASTLAKFANITQMPQSRFDRLGSVITALGNAGASTEKDIAAMGLRIAGAGSFVGMSEHQILGFANALSSVGIEAEAGGTSISKTFKAINSAVSSGGNDLDGFAKVAGMSGSRFARVWKKDAAGASVTFIEGLGRLKKEGKDVPAVLAKLGLSGDRVQDTLLRASGAGKQLRDSLDLGEKSWKENTALTEEARKRYETFASRLKVLKNNLTDIGITIGTALMPPLSKVVKWLSDHLAPAFEKFRQLDRPVKIAVVAFIALAAIAGPVLIGLGMVATAIGAIAGVIAAISAPVLIAVAIIAALAAVGYLVYTNWDAVKTWVIGALDTVRGALNLSRGDIQRFGQAAMNVLNFVKGVAMVFARVWRWVFVSVVFPVVKRILPGVLQIIQGTLQFIGGVVKLFAAVFTGDFRGMWQAVKQMFSGGVKILGGIIRAGTAPIRAAFAAVFSGVKAAVKPVIDWLVDKVKWVLDKIEWALGKVDKIGGTIGGIGGAAGDALGFLPGLAGGGSIFPGRAAVVGEAGPEIARSRPGGGVDIVPLSPIPAVAPADGGRGPRMLQPIQVQVGRRVIAEVVAEVAADHKARQ